ncbi:MAG: hypothetical protein FK734_12755 [Asgard group archaeon]|nr:hypothetical protein [Asgard group archaeon]
MFELTLEGSYYDIGYFLGKHFDSYRSSYYFDKLTKDQIDFALDCELVVRKFFPEILDEIQGIADGGDLEYTSLIVSELSIGLNSGCTVFTVPGKYTKNGKILFARSMDWFNEALPYSYIMHTKPSMKYSSLGFTESLIGRFSGINKSGLAVGNSNCIWSDFRSGVMSGIAVRWILDNCQTAFEAKDFLERIPHIIGDNYLIVDSHGSIARVEAFQNLVVSNIFKDEFIATANHYFSKEFDEIAPNKPKHSTDRIDYLNNWIKNITQPIDLTDLKEIQRVHEVELCPHVREYYNNKLMELTTCWAWVAELGSNKIHLCIGSPCKYEYFEHTL